ncbi:bifunctional diguanylate cyclase/phosphodiesterase [Demequina sp. NBRC 110057]|uniref:putative bifunctional diguanylate cyclase/phosphodiesterase n=1 Tax=Demequina sp. NBRC 110057 TaxID=1570346 RepID=UPI000A01B29A|nr:bifunctional diguanylate cyclase/phosphodiesterase [Demequina sp. NBRC 110057]
MLGVLATLVLTPWSHVGDTGLLWPTVFLAVAAIAGEVKPIRLVLGNAEPRTVSTSAPFILALIAVAGIGVAVVVQVIASLTDDLLQRRAPTKSLFNTAQYAVSVLVGGMVYASLAGAVRFPEPLYSNDTHLAALLIAGIAMVAVNWMLVAGVVAIAVGQRFSVVVSSDAQHLVMTHIVLLSVGGIAAYIAADGAWVLILLAGPVVAAHLFAASAARHAFDATHDSLTGLGNRSQADHELAQALAGSRASGSSGPGLVLIDLDHFKDFNDTLGHPVGDTILRQVAGRLVGAVPPGASVHRLGGDEFAIVVPGGLAAARHAAYDALSSLEAPIQVDALELLVRASAGVAVAPMHGADAETLMKHSDIALYHAKLERDRISLFSQEFDVNTLERLQLLADLRAAISEKQLHVVYQPQVTLANRRTVAVEALVRWHHPERGVVQPDDFIPLAENSGLVFSITAFVLDQALRDLARWRDAGYDLRISVNLSARHLSDLALTAQVADALGRHRVPANTLVLEVTETGIMADAVRADVVIRGLRALGVEIAIDDYGTGNASLGYLRRLEIDELKVDRSFVTHIRSVDHDRIIVRSTIELALALGLRVIAEGIEDEETARELMTFGDVIGQGHHLGRPVPADQIDARLAQESDDRRG